MSAHALLDIKCSNWHSVPHRWCVLSNRGLFFHCNTEQVTLYLAKSLWFIFFLKHSNALTQKELKVMSHLIEVICLSRAEQLLTWHNKYQDVPNLFTTWVCLSVWLEPLNGLKLCLEYFILLFPHGFTVLAILEHIWWKGCFSTVCIAHLWG